MTTLTTETARGSAARDVEPIPNADLRIGDVVDYPHGPAAIVGFRAPEYLAAALGPGTRVVLHRTRQPRIITDGQTVQVLLPRPEAA